MGHWRFDIDFGTGTCRRRVKTARSGGNHAGEWGWEGELLLWDLWEL